MRRLELAIVAGETTCYDKQSDTMCRFVLSSHFGTRWHCEIFNAIEDTGMLQRHPDCIAAEVRK